RLDLDLEIGVALGAFEAQALARGDTRRDRHLERAAVAQGHAALAAARRFEKGDLERHDRRLSLRRRGVAAAAAVEQLRDNVVDPGKAGAAARAAARAESRPAKTRPGAIAKPVHALGAVGADLAAVVARALLRVGQQLIGRGHLLELLLDRALAGVEIGMELLGKPTIGALQLVLRGRSRQAQHGIRISHHSYY